MSMSKLVRELCCHKEKCRVNKDRVGIGVTLQACAQELNNTALRMPCLDQLQGSLSKDDVNENATKQDLCTLCTCVLHVGAFLCRRLQNNNVK